LLNVNRGIALTLTDHLPPLSNCPRARVTDTIS